MNRKFLVYLFGCFTLTAISGFSSSILANDNLDTATELPIEYFTKKSESRSLKISPDGNHIVVILKQKGKEVFGVIDAHTNKVVSVIGARGSGGNIKEVRWINNSRIAYSTYEVKTNDERLNGPGELYAVNVDDSKHEFVFGYRAAERSVGSKTKKRKASYASHAILDPLVDDEKNILIAYYPWRAYDRYWRLDPAAKTLIKKLDVYNGRLRNVDVLPISQARAIVDNQGTVRFAIGVNENNESVVSYKSSKQAEWKEFSLDNFEGTHVYPFSFTKDNQGVYLSANVGNGTRALYLFDLKSQSIDKLFHDESIDISRVVSNFEEREIIYVATEKALPVYHYLEPNDIKSKLHKQLMKAFAGQDVVITSTTKDGKKMIVLVYADNNPGDFYLFDTKTLNAQFLMSRNSWVDPDLLAKTESINFKTRDGQIIYGYLTRPKMDKGEPLPLVVYPHGGPHIKDEWGYQGEVQLLANRGYAVLQVNFRGSSGFGRAFQDIGKGKWGTLMQDDITDATQFLIDQKIADPSRICIYGASYGGYAALMGAVREPDLYKCAIGSAGVYDLPLMFVEGNIPNYLKNGLAYLKEAVGDNIDDLKSRSPVYNVDKIKANILLIHGGKDDQVPIEQALRLKEAFDSIDKSYGWLELEYEGHGYNNNENRKKVYQKILNFLDENIGKQSENSQTGH